MDKTAPPFLSVIIANYNRARELPRAVHSVLTQDCDSFEVIVVDDGSSDDSYSICRAINDDRLITLRHAQNRGTSAARMTAVHAAQGQWIVLLDNDDEFHPGALQVITRRLAEVPASISRVCFSHDLDDGGRTPFPIPRGEILDYEAYLQWSISARHNDMCNCIRRATFSEVPFPVERVTEQSYHLDFAKRFKSLLLPDVVGLMHSDAHNRASNLTFAGRVRKALREAANQQIGVDRVLQRHGNALEAHAPTLFRTILRRRAHLAFLTGNRVAGLTRSLDHLRRYPLWPQSWVTLTLGLIGPTALATAETINERLKTAFAERQIAKETRAAECANNPRQQDTNRVIDIKQ